MAEDMSDLMKNLSSMLNGKEIPKDVKGILENLTNSSDKQKNSGTTEDSSNTIPPEMANLFQTFLNSEKKQDEKNSGSDNGFSLDFETILKLKNIMEKMNSSGDDPRANLLLSLKPYLKESRKKKVDQYVKLFGLGKAFETFNFLGGENKNDV